MCEIDSVHAKQYIINLYLLQLEFLCFTAWTQIKNLMKLEYYIKLLSKGCKYRNVRPLKNNKLHAEPKNIWYLSLFDKVLKR